MGTFEFPEKKAKQVKIQQQTAYLLLFIVRLGSDVVYCVCVWCGFNEIDTLLMD